jgi:pyruvate dehydrogenase E2 component (dihydrolipoamide acetyltransferase)
LAGISGTGEGGMITRDDVKAAASAAAARSPGAEPLPPMRRAIAEATERAWRTIPHVTLMRRADVTDLVTTKRHSLTAAVVRATAIALMKHLRFNGWLVDGAFHARADADIGVAVSAGGLRMPVVRAAQKLPVNAIAAEIESLAASAKAGALEGSRLTDASFSVSSLGRWGVEAFTPVIAGPQVAILGIGAVDRVAREAPGGGIHFRSEMTLSLVFDHRANDGAEAAEFLADIVAGLSDPASLEA